MSGLGGAVFLLAYLAWTLFLLWFLSGVQR